ncbi:unnamed protein product, partial [Discosporangium mesarthrocarpum]
TTRGEGRQGKGGGMEEIGEVVEGCTRAAMDVYHENPAVSTEAMTFLGRYVSTACRSGLPPPLEAFKLAESLGHSAASALASWGGSRRSRDLEGAGSMLQFIGGVLGKTRASLEAAADPRVRVRTRAVVGRLRGGSS